MRQCSGVSCHSLLLVRVLGSLRPLSSEYGTYKTSPDAGLGFQVKKSLTPFKLFPFRSEAAEHTPPQGPTIQGYLTSHKKTHPHRTLPYASG